MAQPLSIHEARMAVDRLNVRGEVERVRFFAYPSDPADPLILVSCERRGGDEIQFLCRSDIPLRVTADDFDEAALAAHFFEAPPSALIH